MTTETLEAVLDLRKTVDGLRSVCQDCKGTGEYSYDRISQDGTEMESGTERCHCQSKN